MLKKVVGAKWWIVAVLFCAVGIPFMGYQKHRAAEKYRNHRAEYCTALMATSEQKKTCEEEKTNADDYLPWGYKLFEWPEGITAWAIIATGFAIVWQSWHTRRAADGSLMQAKHMVTSERPFIMVETRGDKGTEFWIRNCGQAPAQILFIDPLLIPKYPEWVQNKQQYVLPYPPEYGNNYDDDRYEQINLQWLAQGDERYFASFDPTILGMLPLETKGELNQGGRAVRIYSSVKYRGMFSSDVYHSRFCYGWTPNGGTYMTGPYGYNQYT